MPSGLYVHIPFCRSKCPYCGFYSIPSSTLIHEWFEGLKREILFYEDRFGAFDTLYLGGGTPSFLNSEVLGRVMDCLHEHFDLMPEAEITLEANPCDITPEKASALKNLGFNRINLGVQSFDDQVLKFLGRNHSSLEAEEAFWRLRSAGFHNIGLDFMYGLAVQSMKKWIATLRRALSLQPEHLSCYQLTLEKRTVFERRSHEKDRIVLQEKAAAAHFLATASFLENQGYTHYEVSNFARNISVMSRHNQKYWEHTPYLGLGPSAHSFDGRKRWWNVKSVKKYCGALEKGRSPVDGLENLTREQLYLESLALGFRTRQGVNIKSLFPKWEKALLMLQNKGLLKIVNGRAAPTRRGYLLADHLPLYFSD